MKNKYQEALNYIACATYGGVDLTHQINILGELVDKATPKKIKSCTCVNCGTYNETWEKRMNTVTHDVMYCWHCGHAHEFNKESE